MADASTYAPAGGPAPSLGTAVKHHMATNYKIVAAVLAVGVILVVYLFAMWRSAEAKADDAKKDKDKDSYSPNHPVGAHPGYNNKMGHNNPQWHAGGEHAGGLLAHDRPGGPISALDFESRTAAATYAGDALGYGDAFNDQSAFSRVALGTACGPASKEAIDDLTMLQHLESLSPEDLGTASLT